MVWSKIGNILHVTVDLYSMTLLEHTWQSEEAEKNQHHEERKHSMQLISLRVILLQM